MKNLLLDYAHYNLWANKKMCGFIGQLDEPLIDKEVVSSFNSIRKTLQHTWNAETIWLKRLRGENSKWPPNEDFKGKFSEMEKIFLAQSQMLIDFVKEKNEEQLEMGFNYVDSRGNPYNNRVFEALMHCFNHSTVHRGQLITMLRNVGFTVFTSTDLITFFREKSK